MGTENVFQENQEYLIKARELVTAIDDMEDELDQAKALQKQILKTVKPEQKELAVEKGEKAKVKLSSKLDMNNVASVTYNCSDTSIAKVDKNGKVTTKKKGTATITMTVTLNDGSTKRIATTITVK